VVIKMDKEIQYKIIVFVGSPTVGRSAIIHRIATGEFLDQPRSLFEYHYSMKKYDFDDNNITLLLFGIRCDGTADMDSRTRIRTDLNRLGLESNGKSTIVYVFDISIKRSFERVPFFMESTSDIDCQKILVGNKNDLGNNREVTYEEANKLAKKNKMTYIETSAKEGTNFDKLKSQLLFLQGE
jgi:Ras-related protein Rab-1A